MALYCLEGALRAHRELGRGQDEEWLNLALAYLRVSVHTADGDAQSSMQPDTNLVGDVLRDLGTNNHSLQSEQCASEGYKGLMLSLES